MELQLGLALPSNPMKGFDLNSYGCEPKGDLGSDPLSHDGSCLSNEGIRDFKLKKRRFDDAFGDGNIEVVPQTLPLLVWNHNGGEEEDDHSELDVNSSTINKSDGDEDGVVGWPPIKTLRRKLCHQGSGGRANGGGGGGESTYVKVKMEGVAIARKIDPSLHHSYQSLRNTLFDMFGRGGENSKAYKLTYQDKEGDWLLAGDVPWSSFIQSVQRLELIRSID